MKMNEQQLKELVVLLGREKVKDSVEERLVYSYDGTGQRAMPDVVVFVDSTDDVVKLMHFAREHRIAVYCRGAGTGLSGGAVPVQGGMVLSFTRMNHILQIDEINQVCTVEPGAVVTELKNEVEKRGLYYPPDPASAQFSTIGGNVAECAGGLRGIKYGVTRDYVLALEAVTINGEIMSFGSEAIKSVSGYDVMRLLIGSEGTLAVFTKIKLRLVPKPAQFATAIAGFSVDFTALEAGLAVIKAGLLPAALEFMDSDCLRAAFEYTQREELKKWQGLLLLEFDGWGTEVSSQLDKATKICQDAGALHVLVAKDDEERDQLWEIRRSLSPGLYRLAPSKINEDICVPRPAMPAMLKETKAIANELDLTIAVFAHAGDGNMHVNFMFDATNEEEKKRVEQGVRRVFRATLDLKGTITGEHGVGLAKAAYLSYEFGRLEIEMMKKIKKLWDPYNLLNPGKIFVPQLEKIR